jgi:hypothetical protein
LRASLLCARASTIASTCVNIDIMLKLADDACMHLYAYAWNAYARMRTFRWLSEQWLPKWNRMQHPPDEPSNIPANVFD